MKDGFSWLVFLSGVFSNLIRYFWILLISAVLMIIGIAGVNICKIIGICVFILYLLAAVIEWAVTFQSALKQTGARSAAEMVELLMQTKGEQVSEEHEHD